MFIFAIPKFYYANMERNLITIQGQAIQATANASLKDWRGVVASFISQQQTRESTRAQYVKTLTQFFKWVAATGRNLNELTFNDILLYEDDLLKAGNSNLTVGSYLVSVRLFFAWAERNKIYPNIANGIKSPKKEQAHKKQHLTERKCAELLQYYKDSAREYAIINLMLRCGLRCIEVTRLNMEDLTTRQTEDGGTVRVLYVQGKGKNEKNDFVVLSDKAFKPIQQYIKAERRNARRGAPLFISHDHKGGKEQRLTTRSISRFCKVALRGVGLDSQEYTAHSLRHTTAVQLLKHNAPLESVQWVLRHQNSNTTQIYVESIKNEMRLTAATEKILDAVF